MQIIPFGTYSRIIIFRINRKTYIFGKKIMQQYYNP